MRRIGKRLFPWMVGGLCAALPAGAMAQVGEEQQDPQQREEQQRGEAERGLLEQNLEDIGVVLYFEFDSAQLDDAARQELDQSVEWLNENSQRKILIVGHTDEVGPEEYNFKLGGERAMAAQQYLVAQGISEDRIEIASKGETQAISQVQAENRRAIFFSEREEEAPVARVEEQPAPEIAPEQAPEPEAEVEVEELEPQEPQPEEPLEEPFAEERAEPLPDEFAEPEPTPVPVEEPEPRRGLLGAGVQASVGGGVMNYFDDDMRDFTDVAGSWEARLAWGTQTRFGAEVAYVGSAQDVNALGLDEDAVLLSNGGEGVGRVNAMEIARFFRPYAFAGLGLTRFSVVNDDFNTSAVDDGDTVWYVPLGIGVGFLWNRLAFDLRGTVRPTFNDNLIGAEGEDPNMDNWGVNALVGFQF